MARWTGKDPSDIADYYFDWGSDTQPVKDRFLPADETIISATVTVPDGLTKEESDFTAKTVRVRLSGGTIGDYLIDCLITTDKGQVFEVTKTLRVKDRAS